MGNVEGSELMLLTLHNSADYPKNTRKAIDWNQSFPYQLIRLTIWLENYGDAWKFWLENQTTPQITPNNNGTKNKDAEIKGDDVLLSFDVTAFSFDFTALFTLIDFKMGEKMLEFLQRCHLGCSLEKSIIRELMDWCLGTFFKFDRDIYEQIKRTPMGLPMSRVLAEVVMQTLEGITLPKIQPKIQIHYPDGTLFHYKVFPYRGSVGNNQ